METCPAVIEISKKKRQTLSMTSMKTDDSGKSGGSHLNYGHATKDLARLGILGAVGCHPLSAVILFSRNKYSTNDMIASIAVTGKLCLLPSNNSI
jgi:hypothetical protein